MCPRSIVSIGDDDSCTTSTEQYPVDKNGMKKRVTVLFSDDVVLFDSMHWSDYSNQERRNTWYSQEEINQIKLDAERAKKCNNPKKIKRKRKKKKTTTISFHRRVVVHRILHVQDYTDEEVESTWFSRQELNEFRIAADENNASPSEEGEERRVAADETNASPNEEDKECRVAAYENNASPSEKEESRTGTDERLRVCFNRRVAIHKTLHWNDFTEAERESTWYTREEMAAIKEEMNETLEMMEKAISRDSLILVSKKGVIHCSRGLETKVKRKERALRKMRKKSIAAVLEEQVKHREFFGTDVQNPELIALSYAPHTLKAVKYAFDCGVRDQQSIL